MNGATSYSVFRGTTAGGESATSIGSPAAATYSDAGLLAGTTYFYTVSATNAGGTGAVSTEASATTILAPPTALAAVVSVFNISLTWTASPNATSYDVLRSLTAGSGFAVITNVATTSYCNCETTTNLRTPNTTYYYEVVARTAQASSLPSNIASGTTVFPAPTGLAVTNAATTTGSGRTTLLTAWNAVAGASTYSLQRSLSATGPFTEITQPTTNSYTDTGLAFSTTYYYLVEALSPTGASPNSAVASGSTLVSPWLPGSGLSGGDVMAVTFDPANASIAYAGVRGGSGVFKSTNGGLTWSPSGAGLGSSSVGSVAFSAGKLFAGTIGAGIFVSADGGQSWTAANTGLAAKDSYISIVADPANSGIIYAASAKLAYWSTTNGASWTAFSFAPAAPLTALAIAPNAPGTVYAATDGAGIYKTVNAGPPGAGSSWSAAGLSGQSLQGGIVVDPTNSTHLWAGSAAGVQVSSDGGTTWAAAGSLPAVKSLAVASGTLYAGTNGSGVYSSANAGTSWTQLGGAPSAVSGIAALAASGTSIVAASYNGSGLFSSTTSGASWTAATGLGAADATALAISASTPSVLYAVAGYTLSKSIDHGATWSASAGLTYPVVATAVAVDPTNSNIVYVGAKGVRRSTDGGGTFAATGANFVPSGLAIPVSTPGTVYAAVFNGGVYTANFAAATPAWKQINSGITDLRIRAVAVDPANALNLYAGGEGGFYRSINGGTSWTASALTFVRSITVAGGKVFAVVGAGTASNLQVSADAGATFSAVGFGTTAVQNLVSIAVDPTTATTLYATGTSSNGSAGGLYKSIDGGTSWKAIKPGLSSTRLRKMLIDPTAPGSLFLATQDNGVQLSMTAGE